MKLIHKALAVAALLFPATLAAQTNAVEAENVSVAAADGYLNVNADFVLNNMKLKANKQLFITPVVKGGNGESVVLPSILVNGRNMHYAYERGTIKNSRLVKDHNVMKEVRRKNGKNQVVDYATRTPIQNWMRLSNARLELVFDSCGCGVENGKVIRDIPISLNPVKNMRTAMITPSVTALPIQVHEGRARVQFEVDKTELHDQPYVCRNGQRIDNRDQLRMIDDSIAYALTDPNVEIANVAICGYASPESPYLHNEELATNRSRALAEYIAKRYKLPIDKTSYSSVPENWKEFRQQVVASKEITEQQRKDLLELIDRPAYGARDYDAKEQELKTSPKFAALYRSTILPKWFPELRATTFAISTHLKPMSDEELAKVILTTPEKMSLNQMFRVARLYPDGSDEFNKVIDIALKHYPDDPVANVNAAAAEVARGEYKLAKEHLEKSGDSPEANNLRGILATYDGDFEKAAEYFEKAGSLPEAQKNLNLIK